MARLLRVDEIDRLAALRRHDILDTAPEPSFDRIVEQVRDVCRVPIALVSLVDADRQWFKAKAGVTVDETPLATSVCAIAIRQPDILEIDDLSTDERTAGMSLVAGDPHIRFYAGAPLIGSDGAALGSLCAIDTDPRPGGLDTLQKKTLSLLAEQVVVLIEMRTAIAVRDAALADDEAWRRTQLSERRYHAMVDSAIDNGLISFDGDHVVTSWSKGAEHLFGWTAEEMVGEEADKIFTPEDRAAGVVLREFETARAAGRASDERWHIRKDGSRFYCHGAMTPLLGTGEEGFVKALRDVTTEHENRSALSASREKLELATRAARMGQFDFYPQSGDLDWDDRCRELFGLPPGVPVSYEGTYLAGLHPDDRERGADGVLAALDPTGSRTFDLEYRTVGIEDGIERHIHAKGTTLFEGDLPLRLIGTVQDVTAERRARLVLHETEQRLRLAARATNDAIWDWDLVGNHVVWNAALEQTYGHPLDQVEPTGAWWIDHIHPEDRERIDRSIHAVIDGEETDWTDEYRFRRADGSYADIRDRGFVLRDDAGKSIRMIGAMLDQSDRKGVERALRTEATGLAQQVADGEAEIDRMWAASPDLMVVVDGKGVFHRVNPAWTTMLGYAPDELIGHHVNEFVLPENHEDTTAAYEAAAGGQQIAALNRYRHRDGSARFISWVAAQNEGMIYATGRDVTAEMEGRETLRQTEEQLRQAQKMEAVGQLTGGLAHDFNNLLAGISGSLELMAIRLSQGRLADLEKYMTAAQGASRRAAALTHRLLAFSRRQTLDPRPTDVNILVAGMHDLIQRTVGPSVHVEVVGASGLWTVLVDPPQLENALLNLSINARDAMPDGGRITIETANKWLDSGAAKKHDMPEGQYLSLCVTDTGTGMTPDVISKAFDPFFTTKPLGEGTGLGLSMIYGFARQSGGQVRIYSEVGQGTTLCIYLPRHFGEVRELASDAVTAAPKAEQGETVLVVDDEPTIRMLVAEILTDLGYVPVEAADGAAGLRVLQSDVRIDLLVTDIGLPGGMNGRQLADAARVARPELKVLFITGYAENALLGTKQLERGMAVLTKPFAVEALGSRIREMILASK